MLYILSLYRQAFSNLQHNIWILSISMFINRSGSMVLLFTSLYLTKELHFSIGEAGFIMSFYGMGSILGSYAGGWLTDRTNYFYIMLVSLISSGLILFLMLVATTRFSLSSSSSPMPSAQISSAPQTALPSPPSPLLKTGHAPFP
ncbi:MAG: hypothetical protein H0W62_09510 [Chitinophagales bacterium]|nr:hypothetical protein [Chitinophagales bacterium]